MENDETLLFGAWLCFMYLWIYYFKLPFRVKPVGVHKDDQVRKQSRVAIQSHWTRAFWVHKCDHTWFFRCTITNLVACATSWSLTLSPDNTGLVNQYGRYFIVLVSQYRRRDNIWKCSVVGTWSSLFMRHFLCHCCRCCLTSPISVLELW